MVDYMGRAYVQIPKVLEALQKRFGNKVQMRAIDNSGSSGNATLYNGVSEMLRNASDWTVASAREAMHDELDRLYKAGGVPDEIYRAANEPESAEDRGYNRPAAGGRPEQSPAEQERGVLSEPSTPPAPGEKQPPPDDSGSGFKLSANPVFDPDNWKALNRAYDDAIQRFIDKGLKIGDKYYVVKGYDPVIARLLRVLG